MSLCLYLCCCYVGPSPITTQSSQIHQSLQPFGLRLISIDHHHQSLEVLVLTALVVLPAKWSFQVRVKTPKIICWNIFSVQHGLEYGILKFQECQVRWLTPYILGLFLFCFNSRSKTLKMSFQFDNLNLKQGWLFFLYFFSLHHSELFFRFIDLFGKRVFSRKFDLGENFATNWTPIFIYLLLKFLMADIFLLDLKSLFVVK